MSVTINSASLRRKPGLQPPGSLIPFCIAAVSACPSLPCPLAPTWATQAKVSFRFGSPLTM
jgi:hypothetical protein